MKSSIIGLLIVAILLFFGCNSGNKNRTPDTKHTQEQVNDEGHDHDHDHGHDHDHSAGDAHDHDHSAGHTHDHEGEHAHSADDGHNHDHEGVHDHSAHDGHNHDHSTGDDHNHEGETSGNDGAHAGEIHFSRQQAEAVGLQVEEVAPGVFNFVITTSGQILASQGDEAIVVATSAGIVSFVNPSISEGVPVKIGETIVTISAKNMQDGDPAIKAKIEFESAQKEFQRAEILVKDQIISAKEFEQVHQRYETAQSAYHAQSAKMTVNGIRITSPISGYLVERLVGQGEFVSIGQPVATISQNRRLQLRAEVSENYYKNLKSISCANFKTSYDDTVYKLSEMKGRLLSFGKASGKSFFIPVTFEFENRGDIVPGSYAEVFLLSTPQQNILSVPLSSITEEQGLHFAYLQLDEEGYLKQEVSLGQNNGERVQILSGLKQGDKVVTKGVYQVKLAAVSSVIPEGHSHSH